MKYIKFLALSFILFLSACTASAQSGTFLKARCPSPNTSIFQTFRLQSDGNQNAIPCPSGSFLINGAAVPTGTGTANTLPYWTSASVLGSTPFIFNADPNNLLTQPRTYIGTSAGTFGAITYPWANGNSVVHSYAYSLANSATQTLASYDPTLATRRSQISITGSNAPAIDLYSGDSSGTAGTVTNWADNLVARQFTFAGGTDFYLNANWTAAAGRFRVGDFTTTPTNYFDINHATSEIILQTLNTNRLQFAAGEVGLGDYDGLGNDTKIQVNDSIQQIILQSGGVSAFTSAQVFTVDFETRFGNNLGIAFESADACAGSGTIGGGGSVVINTGCVNAGAKVLVTYTSAAAAPAYVNTIVANTSFTVNGTAAATFDYLVVNVY